MIALTRNQWNLLLAGVLLCSSIFIVVTRVGSPGVAAGLATTVDEAAEPAPQADHPAPDFTLASLDGTQVTLSKLKGQVTLINIWATWCPPCRAEMPAIETTYEQYHDKGFTVLAVDLQEDPRSVMAFMSQYKLTFPALLDVDGQVSRTYQAFSLPSSFFVDKNGVIRAVYRGPMPRSVIAGTVEQLLQEGT